MSRATFRYLVLWAFALTCCPVLGEDQKQNPKKTDVLGSLSSLGDKFELDPLKMYESKKDHEDRDIDTDKRKIDRYELIGAAEKKDINKYRFADHIGKREIDKNRLTGRSDKSKLDKFRFAGQIGKRADIDPFLNDDLNTDGVDQGDLAQ
uniref:Allatostatin a3 n=1 Tax=Deroceras reticulatum TaxID=145610 RepID=A0A1X9WEB9_DERRE|nr:allatostatin a3 [Deroceras reticulatum]